MSAKPDLWMPLYIADYLADTQDLSCEEHGAYLLLLMAAWMRAGRLPGDDRKLANIARCSAQQWKRARGVMAYFKREGDEYIQPRLMAEYEHAVKVNEAQKENGKKGGRPRKDKTHQKPMGFDRDNPTHNPNETPPPPPLQEAGIVTPTPPGSSIPREAKSTVGGDGDRPAITPAAACAIALNHAGFRTTSQNPDLIAYAGRGGTPEHLRQCAALPQCEGKPAGYVIAIARREITETPHNGETHAARSQPRRIGLADR